MTAPETAPTVEQPVRRGGDGRWRLAMDDTTLDAIEAWARSEDDERLVLNLVTEVRRLTEEVGRCRAHRTLEQRALANALPLIARAEAAEAERDALRARLAAVEALADQWADRKRSDGMSGNAWIGLTLSGVAADLRAALATAGEGQ